MLHVVILAGGTGTRLWPLSRTNCPKQFLRLLGGRTLLQETVLRLHGVIPAECVWIVIGKGQEFLVRAQLADLTGFEENKAHILTEPLPRNTAAAIGLAAVHIHKRDPEGILVVLPADHWIEQQKTFVALVQNAVSLAQQGMLVTLGIVPDRPETGYGYIRRGRPFIASEASLPNGLLAYQVDQFVEKPDLLSAQHYAASNEYYWNAGIFLWQASAILAEIEVYLPGLYQGLGEISRDRGDDKSWDALRAVYSRLEAISIDYGVLEKSSRLVVVPADIGWSDLGDWAAIHHCSARDERGNTFGPNVLNVNSENSFVYGNGRLIVTIGLRGTVVVDTDDALLICSNDHVQEVKEIVHQLQVHGAEEASTSRTVYRPWGTYTVLVEGRGFKVKRIMVEPGAALSLQLHRHRSEHWVVVSGVAQALNGELECRLEVGQSTYIPPLTRHRLANPSLERLEVIETQTGSYLGEDDIVRLADLYQRM